MKYFKFDYTPAAGETAPVLFFVEVDEERYETRKLIMYADGRTAFAEENGEWHGTEPSEGSLPVDMMDKNEPGDMAYEIDEETFERMWARRREPNIDPGPLLGPP